MITLPVQGQFIPCDLAASHECVKDKKCSPRSSAEWSEPRMAEWSEPRMAEWSEPRMADWSMRNSPAPSA
jgi:hypothetical protein